MIDRHPDGAAPVGVAAKKSGSGFAGFVIEAIFLAGEVQDQWMSEVMAGDSANAVGREKFIFIEHVGKQAAQLILANKTEEKHFVFARYDGRFNAGDEIGTVVDEPLAAALKIGVAIEGIGDDGGAAKHRDKSNHGAGAHGETLILAGEEVIVEEAVHFVPKRAGGFLRIVHGVSDVDVVFPEFAGEVFVDRIAFGEDERDGKHVLREGGHPTGAVGLAQ